MKVIVFGATGMVGQGVLRACLQDGGVERVLTIGRRPAASAHPKVRQLLHADFTDLTPIAAEMAGYDACFFCLGVSAWGLDEAAYRQITYGYTMAAARALLPHAPAMTFIYLSGAGTDSSGHGRAMWARVKGETENALRALPFHRALMFRPGYIQPLHGAASSTPWYRALYAALGPLYPLLARLFPHQVTDTAQLGVAMLAAVRHAETLPAVLQAREINWLAAV